MSGIKKVNLILWLKGTLAHTYKTFSTHFWSSITTTIMTPLADISQLQLQLFKNLEKKKGTFCCMREI